MENLLGVGENTLFPLEPLVFAGLELGALDFARLKSPGIEHTEPGLLVAAQLLDPLPQATPMAKGGLELGKVGMGKGIEQLEARRAAKS